jgi:hypothetical protein
VQILIIALIPLPERLESSFGMYAAATLGLTVFIFHGM